MHIQNAGAYIYFFIILKVWHSILSLNKTIKLDVHDNACSWFTINRESNIGFSWSALNCIECALVLKTF